MDGSTPMDAGAPIDAGGAVSSSGCSPSEICLAGHCFARCTAAAQCATTEVCSTEGACVPRGGPVPDAGPTDGGAGADAGAPGLCAGVLCTMPPACHPATGECVDCFDSPSTQCGGAAPICDSAAGSCVAFVAGVCAPCNTDLDCMDVAPGFAVTCVVRDSPIERVCIAACDAMGGCPRGTRCDGTQCLPTAGSCTGYFAALRGRSCMTDGDCAPLGTPADMLVAGSCDTGTCRQACIEDTDCTGGATCPSGVCI